MLRQQRVSVLFSEPKISQFRLRSSRLRSRVPRFSALQRAENFSIGLEYNRWLAAVCFSALQRAENFSMLRKHREYDIRESFSALQRAENFSI